MFILIHKNCIEWYRRLRRAIDDRVPPARVPYRFYRKRNATSQGQQELCDNRRPRDVLLRYQTIW